MKIQLTDCVFEDCGAAISVPQGSSAEIGMTRTRISRCEKAIEERDAPALLDSLGLPPDTPLESVIEVLDAIRAKPEASSDVIKGSKLWSFIEKSASATTVIQGLTALAGVALKIPLDF